MDQELLKGKRTYVSVLGVKECFDELKSYTKTKNINMKWL